MLGPSLRMQKKIEYPPPPGSKTLFLAICDLRPSLAQSVFDCHLSGVIKEPILW